MYWEDVCECPSFPHRTEKNHPSIIALIRVKVEHFTGQTDGDETNRN